MSAICYALDVRTATAHFPGIGPSIADGGGSAGGRATPFRLTAPVKGRPGAAPTGVQARFFS